MNEIRNIKSDGSINTIDQVGDNLVNNRDRSSFRKGKKTGWRWWIKFVLVPLLVALIPLGGSLFLKQNSMGDNRIDNQKSSGSINTIGQVGDNTIVNNNLDLPEPKITVETVGKNIPNGDRFQTHFKLVVDTKIALGDLYVKAKAPSILLMEVIPQRTGMVPFGHSGERLSEGYVFTTLQNVYGEYRVTVTTSKEDEVTLEI